MDIAAMTESEWLACTYLGQACEAVRSKVSSRKLRLFDVACARHVWNLLPDDETRRAVEIAELFADGRASREALDDAARRAKEAADRVAQPILTGGASRAAEAAGQAGYSVAWANQQLMAIQGHYVGLAACRPDATQPPCAAAAGFAARLERAAAGGAMPTDAYKAYFDFLRDILGPLPFRTVRLDPACLAWNRGAISAVARHIYEGREFQELPTLADALGNAECDNDEIIAHCRGPGPHVRGCWVVDLILGSE